MEYRFGNFYPRPPGGGRPPRTQTMILIRDFYPRPPGGGRHCKTPARLLCPCRISIHALRVEGDVGVLGIKAMAFAFLSTPSGWRATFPFHVANYGRNNFYPRPPGGGRQFYSNTKTALLFYFYPRPPGGGRLHAELLDGCLNWIISIHALRVEGDSPHRWSCLRPLCAFLSTPSGWRATCKFTHLLHLLPFLSTPSGWRATRARLSRLLSA